MVVLAACGATETISKRSIARRLGISRQNRAFLAARLRTDFGPTAQHYQDNLLTAGEDQALAADVVADGGAHVDEDGGRRNLHMNDVIEELAATPGTPGIGRALLSIIFGGRKRRADAIDEQLVIDAWTSLCEINPDTVRMVSVYMPCTGRRELVPTMQQTRPAKSIYRVFKGSEAYAERIAAGGSPIGLAVFQRYRPAWIVQAKPSECVDQSHVQLGEFVKTLRILLARYEGECLCELHQANWAKTLADQQAFTKFLLCEEVVEPELSSMRCVVDSPPKIPLHLLQRTHSRDGKYLGSYTYTYMYYANYDFFKDIKLSTSGGRSINRRSKSFIVKAMRRKVKAVSFRPLQYKNHKKTCAEFSCSSCGSVRMDSILTTCEALRTRDGVTSLVTYRRWENCRLGPHRNVELKKIDVPQGIFKKRLRAELPKLLRHQWALKNDKFMRDRCLFFMDSDSILLYLDFSAKYECKGMEVATSQRSNSAIQLVAMVYTRPVAGGDIITDCAHCWGETIKGEIDQNSTYYITCLLTIIGRWRTAATRRVRIFTDGCSSQFKGGAPMNALTAFPRDLNLGEIVVTTAPTSGFKCQCDLNGYIMKRELRAAERRGHRLHNAFLCYRYLSGRTEKHCAGVGLHHVHRRLHFYVSSAASMPAGIDANEMSKIVIIDSTLFRATFPPSNNLSGIMQMHQFRFIDQPHGSALIYHREDCCWCDRCIVSQWDNCNRPSKWTTSLFKRPCIDAKVQYCTDWKDELPVIGLQVPVTCGNGSRRLVFGVIRRRPFQALSDHVERAGREKILDICKQEWIIEVYLLMDSQFSQYHVYISDIAVLLPVRCVIDLSDVADSHQNTRYINLKESEGEYKFNQRTRIAYLKLLQ